MFSTDNTIFFQSMPSAADLSAKNGYTAKVSSSTWALGGDNDAVGIIINGGAASGDDVTIGFGECRAVGGEAIAIGAFVSSNGSGKLITAASNDNPMGRALEPCGADGDIFRVFIYGAVDETVA